MIIKCSNEKNIIDTLNILELVAEDLGLYNLPFCRLGQNYKSMDRFAQ